MQGINYCSTEHALGLAASRYWGQDKIAAYRIGQYKHKAMKKEKYGGEQNSQQMWGISLYLLQATPALAVLFTHTMLDSVIMTRYIPFRQLKLPTPRWN